MAWLIIQLLVVLVDHVYFFGGEVQREDAVVLTEHDFVAFKAILFYEMEVHANHFKDFDVSDDNSELLFIVTTSRYYLKNKKLKRVSLIFYKLFTTDNGKILFVLALLNGQNLSNLSSL
jgi:hypothetical protein